MIKRSYFISTEYTFAGHYQKTLSHRIFFIKSFLPQHVKALNYGLEQISKDLKVKPEELAVTSFNRLS